MELTEKSCVSDVLQFHPKRDHFDSIIMSGKPLVSLARDIFAAQDRVILRHHIRKFWPDFARIVKTTEMDSIQLRSTVKRLSGNHTKQWNF